MTHRTPIETNEPASWGRKLIAATRLRLEEKAYVPLRSLRVVHECDSTQDVARKLADKGEECVAVVAERQRAGRGRLGRSWEDTQSLGVAVTMVLPGEPHGLEQIALRSGLVASLAIEGVFAWLGSKAKVGLRWPNDVVLDLEKPEKRAGKKLSGTLIETVQVDENKRLLLVGTGINVMQTSSDWPLQLRKKATSIVEVAGRHAGDETLVATVTSLLSATAHVWTMTDDEVVAGWHARNVLVGSWAIFDCASPTGTERVEGVVAAIDPLLRITVRTAKGERQLVASTTTLRHDLM